MWYGIKELMKEALRNGTPTGGASHTGKTVLAQT